MLQTCDVDYQLKGDGEGDVCDVEDGGVAAHKYVGHLRVALGLHVQT